ncbi:MAG: chromate transporter [Burkholderiales bacterium]|nr:chromate transporter [Burkholderiales bacterium]
MAELVLYLALLSLVSVGGVPSVLPEMQRLVVETKGWMSAAEFTQLFAVAQASPGPNVLITALIGWKLYGMPGALAGLAAFCVPAAALAYWAGRLWDRMREAPWRETVRRALVPVTVGLVLSGGWLLATPLGADDWRSGAIAGASAAALYATRLNPLWILAAGGALGVPLF